MVDIANIRHEIAEAAQVLNALDKAITTMMDTEVLVGAAPVRLMPPDAAQRTASEESGVTRDGKSRRRVTGVAAGAEP